MKKSKAGPLVWEHQADATLTQANPVQNTWYTILDTTPNVRIIKGMFTVATANEDIEYRITIDGNVLVATVTLTAGDRYFVNWLLDTSTADVIHLDNDVPRGLAQTFLMEGRSVKVDVRKTSNNGAGTFTAWLKYARMT